MALVAIVVLGSGRRRFGRRMLARVAVAVTAAWRNGNLLAAGPLAGREMDAASPVQMQ
jgi:hypothetical protein